MSILQEYESFVCTKEAPAPSLDKQQIRLLHCALGLSTEILELDQSSSRTNTIEEMGDLLWYLTLTKNVLNIPELEIELKVKHINEMTLEPLKVHVEAFVSLIKKHVIYTKPQELEESFYLMWFSFLRHCVACNLPIEYIIDENRLKLDERYKSVFTPEESEARRDKTS